MMRIGTAGSWIERKLETVGNRLSKGTKDHTIVLEDAVLDQ